MILGFMQNFKWSTEKNPAPTNFREKILAGVPDAHQRLLVKGLHASYLTNVRTFKPKIHTFREDPHNRWKEGMSIQMVYRGPKYSILDHFNKDIPELGTLKGKQKIDLKWIETFIDGRSVSTLLIHIDGKPFPFTRYEELFANDGFDSVVDFFNWFNKDWSGWILHWTDFRY